NESGGPALMRTGGGTGAEPLAGGATAAAGAGGTAGTAACATGATGAVAGAMSQQLVELVDLQPVNKKRASTATSKPTGQRARHFFFIIAFGLCGLRFGFQ